MRNFIMTALSLLTVLGTSQAALAETPSFLSCQAVNGLGTAGIGLGTQGDVLIQTTSVVGTRNDQYTIGTLTRTLENKNGSYLHLINKDAEQAGVLLTFGREMPGDFSRIDGYLYSVAANFNPAKDKAPTVPVAVVTCTIQFN